MKSNILAFFFTIGSIVMVVFIIWFYNMSDRIQPEMRFSSYDLVYDENTKDADLLHGVSAYDAVDGDITDRIVVEKTILNEGQESAVVYYAVSDKSGNVTKQSRVFPADIAGIRSSGNVLFSTDQNVGVFTEEYESEGFNTEGFGTTDELPEEGAEAEGGFQTDNQEGAEGEADGDTQSESTGN